MTKSTPKRPAPPATRARSTTKRATPPPRKGPRGAYSEEQRAEALRLVEEHGTAHAHRVTGVPKGTLSRWTKAAGIDTTVVDRRRTAAATEAVRARSAEVKAGTLELLEEHIAQAGEYLRTVAGVNALAAQRIAEADPDLIKIATGDAGPYAVVEAPEAAEAAKVALALDGLPLAVRDAEGILTRAIHDLQLLRGEATERGEFLVEFNVPRPAPPSGDVPEIATTDD